MTMLKLLTILLLASAAAFAQATLAASAAKRNLKINEPTTLVIALTNGGPAVITALQWSEMFPSPSQAAVTNRLAGAAATAASKQLACQSPTCVVFGLNKIVIADGAVMTADFSVLPGAPIGSTLTLKLQGLVATNAAGTAVPLAPGADLIITVLAEPGDLNSDGRIDLVDLLIMIDRILLRQPCADADLNGDSVCDIRDAQVLVNKAVP